MIRLVLADDHAMVRAGLRALLERFADRVSIVGEAETADGAVRLCERLAVDVVLMDLRFGAGRSGVEATRDIRALPAAPRVLVVTSYDTDGDILHAIEAGASGYLLKDASPDELFQAITAAAAGSSALSPGIATRLISHLQAPGPGLTEREREVLVAVATGMTNREIATAMFLSEATVKSHLVQVFSKLGVRSRTAAVARARERGMID